MAYFAPIVFTGTSVLLHIHCNEIPVSFALKLHESGHFINEDVF